MELTKESLTKAYRQLLLIRRFEEAAFRLAEAGKYANYHAGVGQEAVPVGACFDLRSSDMTMITHRGLGVLLMRGVTPREVMAGLYAKVTSPTRGRIPIYHMAAPELGVLAGTSMVGSVIPLATGAALASKLDTAGNVTISFFGDGAVNRGDFHEGLNLAGIWKLPIVYVCENNFYAKSMAVEDSTAGGSIVARAASYGMAGALVDGNDFIAVHGAVREAIKRARAGEGPTLVECQTYRWTPHSTAGYREFSRTEEEIAGWKAKCPVERQKKILRERGVSAAELEAYDVQIQKEVQEAIDFAEAAPYPAPEVAIENVYA